MSDNHITCPKCKANMRTIKLTSAIVERCEQCGGVWLDGGEREKLLQSKQDVKKLDTGSVETGRKFDDVKDIECPHGHGSMRHRAHLAQQHIGFEECDTCGGSFFDAGELTDLTEYTLAERIRSLFGSRKKS